MSEPPPKRRAGTPAQHGPGLSVVTSWRFSSGGLFQQPAGRNRRWAARPPRGGGGALRIALGAWRH